MIKDFEHSCAHCLGGSGLAHPLYDDDLFWVVCDGSPLTEGHILIIPKEHIATMSNLSEINFRNYFVLYKKIKSFISIHYGAVAIFEHGVIGQTVFHAHTHFLPFDHSTEEIMPDKSALRKIANLDEMKSEFEAKRKYLFFENKNQMWLVDTKLGFPRFFRDIFARLLNVEERADWQKARENEILRQQFKKDIFALKNKWMKHNN